LEPQHERSNLFYMWITIYPSARRHTPVDSCPDREVIFMRPVAPVVDPLRKHTWRPHPVAICRFTRVTQHLKQVWTVG